MGQTVAYLQGCQTELIVRVRHKVGQLQDMDGLLCRVHGVIDHAVHSVSGGHHSSDWAVPRLEDSGRTDGQHSAMATPTYQPARQGAHAPPERANGGSMVSSSQRDSHKLHFKPAKQSPCPDVRPHAMKDEVWYSRVQLWAMMRGQDNHEKSLGTVTCRLWLSGYTNWYCNIKGYIYK